MLLKIEESPCTKLRTSPPLPEFAHTSVVENQIKKPFGFPKTKRLLSTAEFNAVFKKSNHRFRQDAFQLIARTQLSSNSRLGLVIPKKMLKKAVYRNRLKRLIRDEFRRWHAFQSCDVVVILRQKIAPETLYSPDMVNTIRELFTRLDRYCIQKIGK